MLAIAALAQGCAPLMVAGAGTAAVAAHDRRTVGAFVDDQAIELKAGSAIRTDQALASEVHINVTSMNGIVLLTGEAPTSELRDRVLAKVREIDGIRRVVNEIRIAPPSALSARTHDGWLTAKVKTRLMHTENIDSTRVKVVTENDVVYLMGLVTRAEADTASTAAAKVGGVARVVKLFEYLD
ncbi:MAG TPA: BON domain-containing protein [Burkholderiales bacterium]